MAGGVRQEDGTYLLERETLIRRPLHETFDFFSRVENLQIITPSFLRFRMITRPVHMCRGCTIEYRLRINGLPVYWRTLISDWEPPHRFVDVQQKGPYALWRHEHTFKAVPGGKRVVDRVQYKMPLGPLGELAHRLFVGRQLDAIWSFREERLQWILAAPGEGAAQP